MFRRTSWQRARRKRRPLSPAWREILERRVAYYRCLPAREQAELIGLTQVLLGEVGFEAAAGLERVEAAMRVMIASQAALLLLHRPLAELPRLRTVIVYPGAYRARERVRTPEGVEVPIAEERHGEAWAHGMLLLSWDDVVHDSAHIDDGVNVVLHEMAHVLDAETGEVDGIPLLGDRETARRWARVMEGAYTNLTRAVRLRRGTVLGPYAAEDRGEFFAVVSEAFFEAPRDLRAEYPQVYALLKDYYHVDPLIWADCLSPAKRALE